MPSSLLQVVNSLFQTCCNKLGTSSADTTCRQLVNRRVTACLQTCHNLCVFTCVDLGTIVLHWETISSTGSILPRLHLYGIETWIFYFQSEELLQRRDVVSLSFWELHIPYRIGAFSRGYRKLSSIVETYIAFIPAWHASRDTLHARCL
jgi:hypothetical protein